MLRLVRCTTVGTVLLLLTLCKLSFGAEYKFSIPLSLDLKDEGAIQEFTFEIKLGQGPREALQALCETSEHEEMVYCAESRKDLHELITNYTAGLFDAFKETYFVNAVLEEMFTSGLVTSSTGEQRELDSNVDPSFGKLLYDIVIDDVEVNQTLEVGMAYGVSSLYIAQALLDSGRDKAHHVAIDPYQASQWAGIGVTNLLAAGLSNSERFTLVEKESFRGLPALVEQGMVLDMILLDGMHTFDYTLVDFFYADLLLREGGILVLDDLQMPSIQRVKSFIETNRAYELMKDHTERVQGRGVVFRKLKNDERAWDYHVTF